MKAKGKQASKEEMKENKINRRRKKKDREERRAVNTAYSLIAQLHSQD